MLWLLACYAFMVTCLTGALGWLSYKCIRKNLELEDQREQLVDQIEESLDMLDDCYQRIARAADVPVLSDEPLVRELVADIKRAKNAVLTIAGLVVTYGSDDDDDKRGSE